MTFTHIPSSSLTLYDNQEALRYEGLPKEDIGAVKFLRLSSFAERAGCADCGTPVAMRMRARAWEVGVNVGSVDWVADEGREGIKVEKAIFVASKPEWVDVEGLGVKCCERFDEGFEEEVMKGFG